MNPMLMMMLLQGASGATSSALGAAGQGKLSKEQREADLRAQALQESTLNPFRGANAQARSLMTLDRSMNTSPRTYETLPGGYQARRGNEYQMSPEMLQWLTELRQRIASGAAQNPIATVYGKRQAGDLTAPGSAPSLSQQAQNAWAGLGTLRDRFNYKP